MAEISDYLQGLEEQEAQEEFEIVVVRSPVVDILIEEYTQWLNSEKRYDVDAAFRLIERARYTAKDVKDFSIRMKECELHKWFFCSGFFLSALINVSQESDFEIITEHLMKKLCYIGTHNKKNIKVIGDVGNTSGAGMEAGSLIIRGNAELITGKDMSGGEIIIHGNTGQNTGDYMTGGKIIINGDSGWATGNCMRGGEIHVNGKIAGIDVANCKGKIYQNGVQVWPK